MTEVIRQRLNDSPVARWTVLFIVATAMMMGYFVNDVMSPLETLLEMPREAGGLGWSPSDYGFFSGAGSFINVFLLMLFFSGLILDKMGIRFTGTLACSLMVVGTLLKFYGVTADFGSEIFSCFGFELPMSVAVASLGFAVFGVHAEVTKAQELESVCRLGIGKGCFDLCTLHHSEGIRIDKVKIIAVCKVGLLSGEEPVVQSYLRIYAVRSVYPVDSRLYLTSVSRIAAS